MVGKTSKTPAAPSHFSPSSKKLWKKILAEWQIDDAASLRVLQTAMEALDRAECCRQQIEAEGQTVLDRFGQAKAHPLLSAERDARSQFLQAIKQLNLDLEGIRE